MDLRTNPNPQGRPETGKRLNSWKSIGAFFERDERTVRRWEAERGLPVHRVPGTGRSGVYAYTGELLEWLKTADAQAEISSYHPDHPPEYVASSAPPASSLGTMPSPRFRGRFVLGLVVICVLFLSASVLAYRHYFRARLAVAAAPPAASRTSTSPQAQDLYLQGLYHWNKRTPQDLNQALDDFTQSIVHDPNYAPAYAGLANCYNLLREYTPMPSSEAYPRAIAAAQRAIVLDDSLADAHNSLAFANFYWSWDAVGAEREFKRAIALDPNSSVAHHWYATFLMVLDRSQEALDEIEKARKLDPHSSSILADKSLILSVAGQDQQAIALLKQIEDSDPAFLSPHSYLATIYLQTKNYNGYLLEEKKAALLLHDQGRLMVVAAGERGFSSGGGTGMLHAMLRVQQDLYAKGKIDAYQLATTYSLLGDKKQALALLQACVEKREPHAVGLLVDRNFQTLRDDPAFQQLLAKVGLLPLNAAGSL